MRRALESDLTQLQAVYDDAAGYARKVGQIDWPNPFPMYELEEYIDAQELFCFEETGDIVAALRISKSPDRRIWRDDGDHTYLAKVAVSSEARGKDYFSKVMLPSVIDEHSSTLALRLDCLADNARLKKFYQKLGFVSLGDVTFYSSKQLRDLRVTRYELSVYSQIPRMA